MNTLNADQQQHGGKRAGAGRPRGSSQAARRNTVSVRVTDEELAYLERLGDGKAGAGIQRLIQAKLKQH